MIKTKEWLIEARQSAGLTQQQLADKIGVGVPTIAKIEQGQRIGSLATWEKINSVLGDNISVSYDCDDLIQEICEDIELYGATCKCYLYYKFEGGVVVFTDYALEEDLDDETFNIEPGETQMIATLHQALDIFRYQNQIIK